jgi:hypothetical protein
MAKKSLYIFLTSILGVTLFLILDRIAVFIYLYLVGGGYIAANFNYQQFVLWDYFTLTIVLMLGAWYGVALGLSWFSQVYERQSHGGLIDHLVKYYWPSKKEKNLDLKISEVKRRLQTDLWQLEDLAEIKAVQPARPQPIARKVVRKRAPKKIK